MVIGLISLEKIWFLFGWELAWIYFVFCRNCFTTLPGIG